MTYPTPPEPTDAELDEYQDSLVDEYDVPKGGWISDLLDGVEVFAVEHESPVAFIPEVALEDGAECYPGGRAVEEARIAALKEVVADSPAGALLGLTGDAAIAAWDLRRNLFRKQLFQEIMDERFRQLQKRGDQSRPLGSSLANAQIANIHRDNCDESEANGGASWQEVAVEEFWESFSEVNRNKFRVEAIQTMAVLFATLEDLFRDEFTP